jgi:hypothetical protein
MWKSEVFWKVCQQKSYRYSDWVHTGRPNFISRHGQSCFL